MSFSNDNQLVVKEKKQRTPSPQKSKKVLVLAGPTGVGKTDISLQIAALMDGEIVSADSIQVYRGLDIGSAKVSLEKRREIPHHLIDICELHEPFTAVQFYERASYAIDQILARGRLPIVVGGTGFYIRTLIYGPPQGPPSNPEIRAWLEDQMEKLGSLALYEQLQMRDPIYAKTITSSDRQKIIRALEIISIIKRPVSSIPSQLPGAMNRYDFRCWFLYLPKEELYPKIEERCDQMIAQGLTEEVERLLESGLEDNKSAAQAIGYRQVIEFLKSDRSPDAYETFVQNFKRASRQYAKRQFTWYRKEPLFRWVNLLLFPRERVLELILRDLEMF